MLVVRVGDVVKDRRPPEAAALRAVLDNITNTNRVLSKRSGPLSQALEQLFEQASSPAFHPSRQIIEIDLELLRLADFVLELGDIVRRELRRRLAGGFDHELNLRGVFQHDR